MTFNTMEKTKYDINGKMKHIELDDQYNGYMSTYTKCDGYEKESHIYADLVNEHKKKNMRSIELTTMSSKSKVIQLRFCIILVLVAVFVSAGLTTAVFLVTKTTCIKNNESKATHVNKTQASSTKESDSNEFRTLPYMRSACPLDWNRYKGSCYHLYEEKKTWPQARDYSRDIGSDLISIHNFKEATSVLHNLTSGPLKRRYWIGFNDLVKENKFLWSDGSRTDYTRWNQNEPNNFNMLEHCVEVSEKKLWNDANCILHRGFICKMNVTDKCGDGDWLRFNDRCYLFEGQSGTWEQSKRRCEERDSNLVSIDSNEEHSFVTSQASARSFQSWIGLQEFPNSGTFRWSDGKIAENIPWGRGQPVKGKKCVQLGGHGNFISRRCSDKVYSYICEKLGR